MESSPLNNMRRYVNQTEIGIVWGLAYCVRKTTIFFDIYAVMVCSQYFLDYVAALIFILRCSYIIIFKRKKNWLNKCHLLPIFLIDFRCSLKYFSEKFQLVNFCFILRLIQQQVYKNWSDNDKFLMKIHFLFY